MRFEQFKKFFFKLFFTELCESIECKYGALCRVDQELQQPFCECKHLICPLARINAIQRVTKSQPSLLPNPSISNSPLLNLGAEQPVCGSDSRTYMSTCELKFHACQTQQHVQALYTGHCRNRISPVSSVSPKNSRQLQNSLVTASMASVKTSDFLINNAANVYSRDRSLADWCNGVQCDHGAQCVIQDQSLNLVGDSMNLESTTNGPQRAVCQCPAFCSAYNVQMSQLIHSLEPSLQPLSSDLLHTGVQSSILSVICALDGKQYSNICALLQKSCLEQQTIGIKYVGTCGK